MTPVERVLAALDEAGCNPRRSGAGWSARCPAHPDKNPSLSVREAEDGRVLLKCHRECEQDLVRSALGLSWSDLFADEGSSLKGHHRGQVSATYDYVNEAGALLFQAVRYCAPKAFRQRRPDGRGGWIGTLEGVRRVLYRLPEVVEGVRAGRWIVITEGEKDADRLASLGFVATTSPMGAGKWRNEYAESLRDAKVAFLPDNDEPGREHAEQGARSVFPRARKVVVLELDGLPEKGDVSDWLDQGHTAEELKALIQSAPSWEQTETEVIEDEWPLPVPLPGSGARPSFPVEVLPLVVREMVIATADNLATPVDLVACMALGCTDAAIVGAVEVEPRPRWREAASLYVAGVASPGEAKTPLVRALRVPLEEVERQRREAAAPQVREAKARQKFLRSLETRAGTKQDWEAANTASKELTELGEPVLPRLLVQDATPEALVGVLAENRGRIAYVVDEGGEVFELMRRYSTNGKSNLGIFLAGWDGTPYSVDRAGTGHQDIERTTMTMALMVQPAVVQDLLGDSERVGRGLPQRFLWSWPESKVGRRPVVRPEVPEAVREKWADLITSLADLAHAHRNEDPLVVPFDSEARNVFDAWRQTHEPRLAGDGDLASIAEWGAKLPGQVARLALVLHVATVGTLGGHVSREVADGAVALGRYFARHALYTFGVAGTDDSTRDAVGLLGWIARRERAEFTIREVSRSRDWVADRVRSALDVLCRHEYVRPATLEERRTGRPPEKWEVNPHLVEGPRQNLTQPPGNGDPSDSVGHSPDRER